MIKIIPLLSLLLPAMANALCLSECQKHPPSLAGSNLAESTASLNTVKMSSSGDKQNIGSVKNSVLGDMNIRIGHQRVDIKTEDKAHHNVVDTSINSTIILGDMEK
jgi:hypothetical protein